LTAVEFKAALNKGGSATIRNGHLTRVHRLDSITLDKTYFTEEGYLVDEPIVTSCGIFEYKNPDGSPRRELRLPEHVFAPESLASYEGKPVIITHSAGRVNKKNVEREIVGTILSAGYRDGNDVRAKIIIHGIDEALSSGFRELSLGYDLVLDETPGEWEGQEYDAIQTGIKINHLALVGDARAGEQARLNIDGENNLTGGKNMSTKSKMLSGDELKNTIAAYQERRQKRLDEAEKKKDESPKPEDKAAEKPEAKTPAEKLSFIKAKRDGRDQIENSGTPEAAMGVIAQQDEDIDELIGIIEAMQAKSDFDSAKRDSDEPKEKETEEKPDKAADSKTNADSVDIDAIISERLRLARIGDRLNLDGLEELKPSEAKKAIIKKVNPGMRLDGKGDAYIDAAFDIAVTQFNKVEKDTDYQRKQASGRMDSRFDPPTGKTGAEKARERMIEKMNGGNEE
jgi:hypothetical protein